MKKLFSILILTLTMTMIVSCTGEGSPETTAEITAEPVPETTADLSVEPVTVKIENPGWGFPSHAIEIADETMVSAELEKASGDVTVTSLKRGETEIKVLDCFGHSASIKLTVAEDGNITYEATPCTEEFISAVKYGIVGGKSDKGQPDQSSKLQALIDKVAKNGGGEIFIYPGFYNIKLLTMREGVTLRMYSGFTDASEGYTDELAAMVKKGEVTVLLVTRIINVDYNDYANNGSKNFTLSGGVIDNNHSTQSTLLFGLSENIVVENMIFKDIKNNHVIQITGCNNVTVRNCIFAGFEWGGTFTRETIQVEQSHPCAHSSNPDTTPIRFYTGDIHGCKNIVIDSCYFGPSDELPGAHIAIGHHGTAHEAVCDGFKITNNVFDRPTYAAIRFANITNVDITGNKFIATADSNKFCENADPAFIILYANTGTVKYDNIVNGLSVTKAVAEELSGTHNVNISGNEFTVEKGSDKKIIVATGTNLNPGAVFKTALLRQDSYDSKPFKLSGYLKTTNFFSNIKFSDNKVTFNGQTSAKDSTFSFVRVFGLTFENNEVTLNDCSFKYDSNGIQGLYTSGTKFGINDITYTVSSQSGKYQINLKHADGSEANMKFSVSEKHIFIAQAGGYLDITQDGNGNVTFTPVAKEGYTFVGWSTDAGDFNTKGSITIAEKTTFTAKFIKN